MIVVERPVAFYDVDAAGLVFYAQFLTYCHEAKERLFAELDGGYTAFITRRRLGFPAVHVKGDFMAPLRFGDTVRIEVTVPKIGTSSCTFRHRMTRASDGAEVATFEHVYVCTALDTLTKVPLPDDCRAALMRHAEPAAPAKA